MRIIPSDGILIHTKQPLGRPQKNCLLHPYLPTFNSPPAPPPSFPYPELFFWHFWEMKHFLALFSSEITIFSHDGAMKEKQNNINLFFPSYLPNQKKYRVGVQQTNTFLRMALWILFLANMPIIFNVCVFGSARLLSTRLLDMWFRQYCSQMK